MLYIPLSLYLFLNSFVFFNFSIIGDKTSIYLDLMYFLLNWLVVVVLTLRWFSINNHTHVNIEKTLIRDVIIIITYINSYFIITVMIIIIISLLLLLILLILIDSLFIIVIIIIITIKVDLIFFKYLIKIQLILECIFLLLIIANIIQRITQRSPCPININHFLSNNINILRILSI